MKFRKKPVVIEAIRWDGDESEVMHFMLPTKPKWVMQTVGIETLEGVMTAQPGDWIIKGVNGEFYPCKPDIFEKTYEAIAPEASGKED